MTIRPNLIDYRFELLHCPELLHGPQLMDYIVLYPDDEKCVEAERRLIENVVKFRNYLGLPLRIIGFSQGDSAGIQIQQSVKDKASHHFGSQVRVIINLAVRRIGGEVNFASIGHH